MMKHTKRILAVLLTLVLALGLAMPAMAAVNWNEFRITRQPQNQTIRYGDSFTLSVEVNVPEGVVVSFQWQLADGGVLPVETANSAELQLSPGDPGYPAQNFSGTFRCVITAYEKDDDGNVISDKTLTSETVRVMVTTEGEIERSFWERVYSVTIWPFVYATMFTLYGIMLSMGLLIPLAPFYFLFFLVDGFIEGIRGW